VGKRVSARTIALLGPDFDARIFAETGPIPAQVRTAKTRHEG
jgi:hypothetical protein